MYAAEWITICVIDESVEYIISSQIRNDELLPSAFVLALLLYFKVKKGSTS